MNPQTRRQLRTRQMHALLLALATDGSPHGNQIALSNAEFASRLRWPWTEEISRCLRELEDQGLITRTYQDRTRKRVVVVHVY